MKTASQMAKESQERQKRVDKIEADRLKGFRTQLAQQRQKRAELDRIAAAMTPVHPVQHEVSARLTARTTQNLIEALQHLASAPARHVAWIVPTAAVGADVLGRAYPLSLQCGILCRFDGVLGCLVLTNGSLLDVRWPGKPALAPAPAAIPASQPAPQEGD